MADTTIAAARRPENTNGASFYGIFAAGFMLFLVIALVAQAMGWQWRSWLPGAEGAKSLVGGVKAAVYTFMSHLL
jgi:light-harvesting complex 1 beta chain